MPKAAVETAAAVTDISPSLSYMFPKGGTSFKDVPFLGEAIDMAGDML